LCRARGSRSATSPSTPRAPGCSTACARWAQTCRSRTPAPRAVRPSATLRSAIPGCGRSTSPPPARPAGSPTPPPSTSPAPARPRPARPRPGGRFRLHQPQLPRLGRPHARTRRLHRMSLVLAIDGPAAAGKGTLARRLAAELGLKHLDTGLLYRAVGRLVLDASQDPADPAVAEAAALALQPADLQRSDLRGPPADE